MKKREEMSVDKSRGFGATMTVINADISRRRRGKNLTLVLEAGIGLNNVNGEIAGGVRLQVHVPEQPIAAAPATATRLQRSTARPNHHSIFDI